MKSPKDIFRQSYYRLLKMDYAEKSLDLAIKDVYKYLADFKGKITEATEKRIQTIITKRYTDEFNKRKAKIKKLMPAYYRSQKYKYRIKKDTVSYDFTATDTKAVKMLAEADILWILNHAADTEISRLIQGVILQNIEAGLTGQEITGLLKAKFAEYGPKEWIAKFGEQKYWGMVTQNTVQRTSGFANINSMQQAGAVSYIWQARGPELACAYCGAMHGTEYLVPDAIDKMEKFNESVE